MNEPEYEYRVICPDTEDDGGETYWTLEEAEDVKAELDGMCAPPNEPPHEGVHKIQRRDPSAWEDVK